jgi:hypothetical protein
MAVCDATFTKMILAGGGDSVMRNCVTVTLFEYTSVQEPSALKTFKYYGIQSFTAIFRTHKNGELFLLIFAQLYSTF